MCRPPTRAASPAFTPPDGSRSSLPRARRRRSLRASTRRWWTRLRTRPCARASATWDSTSRRASCRRRRGSPPSTRPRSRNGGRSSRPPASRWNETPRLGRLLCQQLHGALESRERGGEHAPVHQLLDDRDRLAIGPDFLGLGVEPDAFWIDVGDALDPHRAGLLVDVLDRAAGLQDLVGAHGGVADEDHLVVVAVLVEQVGGARALRMPAPVVLPHEVVQAVVEVVELEVLELGLRRGEQLLGELDVLVHGAADVHQHQHLDRVAALRPHVDVQISLLRRAGDRVFQVELLRRAFPCETSQPSQGDFDVPRAELDRIVEVAILARIPHLHRAAVARALLADAHAFRVVALRAERRGAGGADPLVAALVPALLLLEPLAQRLHQLLPAAEGLDLLLLLLRQRELGLLQQPFQWYLGLRALTGLDAVPELAEGAVELVEVRLVLHQRRARQVVELLDRLADDPHPHRLEQRQVLLDGDRKFVRLQLEEEIDQHRAACGALSALYPHRPLAPAAPRG